MISSVKVNSGFAADLPCLKGKTFEFKPGLNILFSPNGTGKSTLLSIMGAYCGINCKTGGWSRHPEPLDVGGTHKGVKFPDAFAHLSPSKCTADLKWDGTPTFINNSATDNVAKNMGYFIDDASMSPDGLVTDMGEQLSAMWNVSSQGQNRMNKLNKVFMMLDKKPDLTSNPFSKRTSNDNWISAGQAFVDYVKSLNPTGVVTILLDEPEKSLSMEMQFFLWHMAFPKIALERQLIIATHCPMSLFVKTANFLDLQEGYTEKAKRILRGGMDPENSKDVWMEVQLYLAQLLNEGKQKQKEEPKPDKPSKGRDRVRKPARVKPVDRTADPIKD